MPTQLTSAQYRTIAIAVLVSALSLGITLRYFHRSFPEASLTLRVNRSESEQIASRFLKERGVDVEGYRHAAIFDYDDESKLYLERTQGLERMNQLAQGPVRLWRWSHRWFKPLQEEEFNIDVTSDGDVARFSHTLPENEPGENLDEAQARAMAEDFLAKVMNRSLSDLEFLDSSSTKRPARTDHSFTWKQRSVDLGEGSLRVVVSIKGAEVGGYQEYVKVPEQWSRDYERLRSRNLTVQTVDEVFFVLLSIGMLVILILRVRDHDVPVRTSFSFGGVGALLFFLSRVNSFPLEQFSYNTTDSYASFLFSYFIGGVTGAIGVGVFIFFLVAAAEPMYREGFPAKLSFRRYFTWRGLRTRSFFIANIVGIALAFFFFGYQTVFYFLANKLGAWAPSDLNFTNDLSTRVPWMEVLFMGFFPAVSEEMQFRAFAIPFLNKLFRSLPAAVVVAAFNWGFLHAAYPNQPFYIRGLEVGLGGIVTGVIMLRFGILATLIWHYSVDALYTAFVLLRSPDHYLMISGAITAGIMLVPLTTALIAYLRTGTFEDEAPLTNASEGIRRISRLAEEEAGSAPIVYERLSRKRLAQAGVLIACFAASAVVPVYRWGKGIGVAITGRDATKAADSYLRIHGIDPSSYHSVSGLQNNEDPLTARYMLEHLPLQQADQLYRKSTQVAAWEVRYFRPLEKEEHEVYFDATNGKFVDHRHTLDENAPGASLSMEDARKLAENAFPEHGYSLGDFDLQDSRANKRPAREDYSFVWQVKPGDFRNVADAHYRVQAEVAGDQVVSFSDYFKLPEEWVREREKKRTFETILEGIAALLAIVLAGKIVGRFVAQLRHGSFAWRAAAPWAAVAAVLAVVGSLNGLPGIERGYYTSVPLSTFWVQVAVRQAIAPVVSGFAALLLIAFALSLYPTARYALLRSRNRIWRRDAAVAVALTLAVAVALQQLDALAAQDPSLHSSPVVDFAPGAFEMWSPALAYLVSALQSAILSGGAIAVVIGVFIEQSSRRRRWLWASSFLVMILAIAGSDAHTFFEFLGDAGGVILICVAAFWFVSAYFRDNALAYVASIFTLSVTQSVVKLLSQPAAVFRWNGFVLAILALAVLGWLFLPLSAGPLQQEPASEPLLPSFTEPDQI